MSRRGRARWRGTRAAGTAFAFMVVVLAAWVVGGILFSGDIIFRAFYGFTNN